MKKNNFAEEYAREAAIKAQYHEAEKAGSKEGQEAARDLTMNWRSRSRQREIPTQESTGYTARHRIGAMSILI